MYAVLYNYIKYFLQNWSLIKYCSILTGGLRAVEEAFGCVDFEVTIDRCLGLLGPEYDATFFLIPRWRWITSRDAIIGTRGWRSLWPLSVPVNSVLHWHRWWKFSKFGYGKFLLWRNARWRWNGLWARRRFRRRASWVLKDEKCKWDYCKSNF